MHSFKKCTPINCSQFLLVNFGRKNVIIVHSLDKKDWKYCLSLNFSNKVFCRERERERERESEALFFVTLHLWSYIFPENFIEISQIIQKIWTFYSSILTVFVNYFVFYISFSQKKLMMSSYNRWCQHFLPLTYSKRLI